MLLDSSMDPAAFGPMRKRRPKLRGWTSNPSMEEPLRSSKIPRHRDFHDTDQTKEGTTQGDGERQRSWCYGSQGSQTTLSWGLSPHLTPQHPRQNSRTSHGSTASYLAEKHNLLPDTQFGGRPGRTTEQALLLLSNAIDRAWYKHRVVTLVAFDLNGAFNGVNKLSLNTRLRVKGINRDRELRERPLPWHRF